MTSIHIREASADDLKTIQALGKQTFYETFAPHNSEEQIQQYLKESFAEDKLTKELNNPHSQFFIAWEGENPVGYLKLNSGKAQTELQDDASLEIERIYVKSSYQGKKVGQLLYTKAWETAVEQKKKYLWLGVWEQNLRAVAFYKKNGFEEFDKHIFRMGSEEQTDLMMRKILDQSQIS
ncbi:ribosomal protein S18 acetylase RimI-like enzyme [Chryseobacterium sp. SORGH_AS 447]|uniref:GNAT family N-acetyltransferase n=1 Tax=Chryseobacterium sp. SORGH_AS_0447 TaxID=3041769 RepID=UPI00278438CC|nr:GNAT family N-acetyltransferase [Chryseobacterium sp. SORGH_AS_0447]MDQ1162137.1 ribosomal protein S18 acetylase RimI-like enzyme [Chryseobacterium sp. SORGH_AS_0447]